LSDFFLLALLDAAIVQIPFFDQFFERSTDE